MVISESGQPNGRPYRGRNYCYDSVSERAVGRAARTKAVVIFFGGDPLSARERAISSGRNGGEIIEEHFSRTAGT